MKKLNHNPQIVITEQYVIDSLTAQVPDAVESEIAYATNLLCDGKKHLPLDKVLLNVFVNMPLLVEINKSE